MSTSGWVEGRLRAVMEDLAEGRLVLKHMRPGSRRSENAASARLAEGGLTGWPAQTGCNISPVAPVGLIHENTHTFLPVWVLFEPISEILLIHLMTEGFVTLSGSHCGLKVAAAPSPLIIREQVIISTLTFLDEEKANSTGCYMLSNIS